VRKKVRGVSSGAQPGFCYGSGLKMENLCDVVLMTYFRLRNLYEVIKMTSRGRSQCL